MKKIWVYFTCLIILIISCRSITESSVPFTPTVSEEQATGTPSLVSATSTSTLLLLTPTPFPIIPTITASSEPTATLGAPWEWERSVPEAQGVSSNALAAMLETIQKDKMEIHSIVVIRYGMVILEAYVYPFNPQTRHGVYSVTKSFTSALVGITAGDGLLGSVDTPVIRYFPEVTMDDRHKELIHVENLLTMTSGIEWMEPLHSGLNDHWYILESNEPAQYFFTPAITAEPGTVFNYNSGGSHMLSMIVQVVTGKTAEDFAKERLFAPLDIRDYSWKSDFSGHTQGGTGLELLPLDMAKFGQVYLNGGLWQGEQVVPAEWIADSSSIHSLPSDGMGYGYQWWVRPQGDFYALGWGGQQVRVFPEQDMVVVFTAGMSGQEMLHDDLVDTYLLASVISDEPLEVAAKAQARLDAAIESLASPVAGVSTPPSPLADEIDGKEWLITGRGDWSMFTLHFPGGDEAQIDLTLDADSMPLAVGLDGIYRVTDTTDYGPIALYGYWEADDIFVLVQQNLREADRRVTRLQFSGETVKLYSEWFVEPYSEESEGELFGN